MPIISIKMNGPESSLKNVSECIKFFMYVNFFLCLTIIMQYYFKNNEHFAAISETDFLVKYFYFMQEAFLSKIIILMEI